MPSRRYPTRIFPARRPPSPVGNLRERNEQSDFRLALFLCPRYVFRPHPRSKTVLEIMKHQLLSERRLFGEFMGVPEPLAPQVLPVHETPEDYVTRMQELAEPRLTFLANQTEAWWLEQIPFFYVTRERIWLFWRRLLHTCNHRTQLTIYLRMMKKSVPSTYGPTADVTWEGADPTQTAEAASRK